MSYGYPGGMRQSDHDRAMGDCSIEDANEIQRRLEERAEEDWRHNVPEFREWLGEQDLRDIAELAVAWDQGTEDAGHYLANKAAVLFRDWIEYRVATMDEFTRAQIEKDVLEPEAA